METTSELRTIKTLSSKEKLFVLPVLKMLENFQEGSLTLTLPDGQVIEFKNNQKIEADIQIKNLDFFKKVILFGDIGFGESYMDGDWNSSDVEKLLRWMILNIEFIEGASGGKKESIKFNLLAQVNKFRNFLAKNSKSQAQKNIHYHYDLSNEFFKLMLDETMTYSCGIFTDDSTSLKDSQINKYQSLADMLNIQKSDSVLEIGSGWGGNAIFLAKNYGCSVHSITISREQLKYAQMAVKKEGLEDLVTIEYRDFRDLPKLGRKFDKIVSIEMIEAIGEENMDLYFEVIDQCLSKKGLASIQVITSPDSRYEEFRKGADWIQKHIFPGSLLPSIGRMTQATISKTDLHLVKLKDIGTDYATTLRLWRENFFQNIEQVKELGFDEVFIRKWEYYLCYCEAAFTMRNISDLQLTFSRPNNLNY